MSKLRINDEFKPTIKQLQEHGAEVVITGEGDDDKTVGALKSGNALDKEALDAWEPDHKLSFLAHLNSEPTEEFLRLLEQLAQAGVNVVPLADEDYDNTLAELKQRSPLSAKVLSEMKNEMTGWTFWPSWGSWNRNA
jgi:hypothetical protein